MLRTLFVVGLMALVGLILLKVVFGILPVVLGIFLGLAFLALKILAVGAVAYIVLRLVAPSTARRLRERFSGTPTTY
jgi:hypothetical protein